MKPLTWTAFALAARAATARYIDRNKNQLAMNSSGLRCARQGSCRASASHRIASHAGRGEDDDGETTWTKAQQREGRGFFASSEMIDGTAGQRELTEARDSWLSILKWLMRCSIGGEQKGGPGQRFGGGREMETG